MCLDYHLTIIHTSSIVCIANLFIEDQYERSFSVMVLISALEYLASRMRFILFVSELKGALYCYSANALFVV